MGTTGPMFTTRRSYFSVSRYTMAGVNSAGRVSICDGHDLAALCARGGFNPPPPVNHLAVVNPPAPTSIASTANSTAAISTAATSAAATSTAVITMPFEVMDLIISWKDCAAIFSCLKDVRRGLFIQVGVVEMNDAMRKLFFVPLDFPMNSPHVGLHASLTYENGEEELVLSIYYIIDHSISFMMRATKSGPYPWTWTGGHSDGKEGPTTKETGQGIYKTGELSRRCSGGAVEVDSRSWEIHVEWISLLLLSSTQPWHWRRTCW